MNWEAELIYATEGLTIYLSVDWSDRNGAPATPSEVRFGSFDAETGEELMAPESLAGPFSTTTVIKVPPEATACRPGTTKVRIVAIEIQAKFPDDDQLTLRKTVMVQPLHMV